MTVIQGFRPSTQQKRLWSLLHSGTACRAQAVLHLAGPLDVPRLEQAFDRVVARHEILRTRFHCEPGMKFPVQVVDAQRRVHVRSGEGADAFERAVEAAAPVETLEVVVVHLAADEHSLVVRLPALHADTRTLELLLQIVAAEYAGASLEPDDDPLQYIDFTEWQAGLLDEPGTNHGAEFWRDANLAAAPPIVLPFASHARPIPAALREALMEVAARVGASPSEIVHACWVGLQLRLSGATNAVTGLCASGRTLAPMHAALGPFAHTVPVRVEGSAASRFEELLGSLRAATVPALKWQHHLRGDEEVASAFEYVERAREWTFAPGLRARWLRVEARTDRHARKLVCVDDGAELALELHCDGAAEQLVTQLVQLLAGVVRDPRALIASVPLVTEDERAAVLAAGRGPEVSYGTGLVHELFEAQVCARPDALALVDEDEQLTYAAADRLAEHLGHHLQTLGVGPEQRVAVLLPRDVRLVVALLAVSKAGGAYVALDGHQPVKRLQTMLEESSPTVVLTHRAHFPAGLRVACAVVELDQIWDGLHTRGAKCARRAVAGNGAYVIFTSGSTGRPKAVVVEHRQLSNYVQAVSARLGFEAGQRHAWVSTVAADLGHTGLYGALCTGGELHVIREERTREPTQLAAYFRRAEIDCLKIVPSHLHALTQQDDPSAVLPRARLVLGGETARPAWLAEWRKAGCVVHNHYGPTEATVGALTHRIESADDVPLGLPLANVVALVLDATCDLVSRGEVGELHLGGAGVARGYLGRPDATAERFVPHPYARQAGERVYKTGDLARQRLDGAIDFLGRRDHQVKIRGFRVELGEIRAALTAHPQIEDAVAVLHTDGDEPRLVGYYVAREPIPSSELRRFLSQVLIDAAIPAQLVHLARMPLTANGKVDRDKLPRPDASAVTHASRSRSPLEEIVAGIWSDLLGTAPPDPAANFFDLGGHSLLATRVISRVREQLGVELPVAAVFDAPTVAGFAERLATELRGAQRTPGPITRTDAAAPPLSSAQRRLWFMHQLDPDSHAFTSGGTVRLRGALDTDALARSLAAIIDRHDILRTTVQLTAGRPTQVVSPSAPALIVEDLTGEAALAERIERASVRPFDLAHGPLFRALLLRVAPDDHTLVITMHHIVSDGWSVGVLIRELVAGYDAFSRDRAPSLPALPIQYADFAAWQQRWLDGEAMHDLLAYWRGKLAGRPTDPLLPTDHPRPDQRSFRGDTERVTLGRDLSAGLHALSHRHGATLFMTLLAGFQALLHHHTGATDLVLGTDIANRTRVETEPLIGFFVNLLVLRTDLGGDPSFVELLARTRRDALDAYAHQDMPFDRLVGELEPERDLQRTPLFQVLFVLQNTPHSELRMGELEVTVGELPARSAKFDLALFVEVQGDELVVAWNYSTELFERATIAGLAARYARLLAAVVANPHARLGELEAHKRTDELALFSSIQPKAVRQARRELVKTRALGDEIQVFESASEDVDLADWAHHGGAAIERTLVEHGALLFRGFSAGSAAWFEHAASTLCAELYAEYGDLPREQVGGRVYGSTPYPSDQRIEFHHESSHLPRWPRKIFFHCVQASPVGGETPLADGRRVLALLPASLREKFAARGLTYVRCFREGLDVRWQDFFGVTSRSEVEAKCRTEGLAVRWLADGTLRTERRAEAVRRHPETGDAVFFNQILLHHAACLPAAVRDSLLAMYGAEGLPRQVYFGDGGAIGDDELAAVAAAYEAATVKFPWQAGDLLVVDNMRVAHGRSPFSGPRKILVAMGDMTRGSDATSTER